MTLRREVETQFMRSHACPRPSPSAKVVSKSRLPGRSFAAWRASYQSLHGAVQSMSVVSAELGVGSLQRGVTRSLRLLDTVVFAESAPSLSSTLFTHRGRGILSRSDQSNIVESHTHCGEPSSTGCAGTSSLTLSQLISICFLTAHMISR